MTEIINYYNQIAKTYDDDRFNNSYGEFIDKQERKILDKLLKNKSEVVLDLACGSGRLLNYANYGLDGSEEMIRIAKQKHPEKELFVSDAETLPFKDNSVDTIISFHFFMHLPHSKTESILIECYRVLKPEGRFIFDIPSKRRRKLLNFKSVDWHAASSYSLNDLHELKLELFSIKRTFGLLFFPIHRIPRKIRKYVGSIDRVIANSFLKEYSSYLIVEFEKNA